MLWPLDTLTFTDPFQPEDGHVAMSFAGDAAVSGGVLRLVDPATTTHMSPYEQVRTSSAGLGSAVLTPRRPYEALHWFELSFDLLIDGHAAHGAVR